MVFFSLSCTSLGVLCNLGEKCVCVCVCVRKWGGRERGGGEREERRERKKGRRGRNEKKGRKNKEEEERSFSVIAENAGFIRHELSLVMRTRTVPQLTFVRDSSMEYGSKMDALFSGLHEHKDD